jgi:predicted dehydrogenase
VIGLGIIACGDVAFRTYIPGILPHANRASVVATFDPIQERAERAAAMFPNATAYTEFEPFLQHSGLQGVFNLTPATLHTEINNAALDAGMHVFTEKPITTTLQEGQELAERAGKAGKLLLCAPATMATDRFQWLKRLIDEGRIGTPTVGTGQMVNMGPAGWRGYTGDPAVFYSKDVGPVLDTAVYVLHGMTGLFGPAKRVQAFSGTAIPKRQVLIPRLFGQTITVEAPDINLIQLDFGNNCFGQVLSSFAVPASQAPAMEIHGSAGSVSISMSAWYDATGPVDLYLLDNTALGAAGWIRNVGTQTPEGPPNENLIGAGPRHFIDCIEGSKEPILTAAHAIHVLDIILSAQESALSGVAIDLETGF